MSWRILPHVLIQLLVWPLLSGQHKILDPSLFHIHRAQLINSFHQFEINKEGRVAFLGGSITYNTGWRDSVMQYLEKRFPETKFEFVAAGIPSMGSTPAAFRLERDVLRYGRIDLLFEEATVNDETNGRSSLEQIRAMEGIFRRLRSENPKIDLVLMHFVDPAKMNVYRRGQTPQVILNHERVAIHYQVSSIHLAKEVTERIDSKEFSWEDDFRDLHPSPFGQGVYARSIIHFLDNNYGAIDANLKPKSYPMPDEIDPVNYSDGMLIDVSKATYDKGWSIIPRWSPDDGTGSRPNYTDVPMLVTTDYNSPLLLNFKGQTVGIAVAAGQDAGVIQYRIDQGNWQELNLKTRWSESLHLPWFYTLEAGLSDELHNLEIRLVKSGSKKKTACRIRYFYVTR